MEQLKGKNIAIVAMGQSQLDFHLAQTHSITFDEVWAINAMIGVLPNIDRAFILDPMSRFLDTENAGTMTHMMRETLPLVNYPIYSCELDIRVPAVVEYPLEAVVAHSKSAYLNNTVAYAIAFALWSKVAQISIFGVDFTYKSNMHFAESGRGCVEFWIAKCINQGINVGIAPRSSLLDTDIDTKNKLYGYHRLDNPKVTFQDEKGVIKVVIWSDLFNKNQQNNDKPVGIIGRKDLKPVEPNKY
tara:strand:- start:167 stop:898 length:732 start_codon:yes stop_codon:yes gene_type:complete